MDTINERLYKEYLKKYAIQHNISEGEASKHALVIETKKLYDNMFVGVDFANGSDYSPVHFECGDCQ